MKNNLYYKYLRNSREYDNKLKLTSLTKLNSGNKDKCCIIS
jgi:hypothetical protein